MGRPLARDVIGRPTRWLIAFDREAASWWTNFIAFGHYKHVRAFGYVDEADAYVFYDVQFTGTVIQVARGAGARALMGEWAANADLLRYDSGFIRPSGGFIQSLARFIRPLICTTAIAHLLGLPGALRNWRPDGFYRACIESGAKVIIHGRTEGTTPAAGSDAGPADVDRAAPAADCGPV